MGDVIDNTTVTQTERKSVIGWCVKFAKSGPWRSIRSKRVWCKLVPVGDGGEVRVKVGLRVELFAQQRGDRRLCVLTQNKFSRRCERYGVGTSTREDRPHGLSVVVLNDAFVADLIDSPADSQDLGAEFGSPSFSQADSEDQTKLPGVEY